jgi:hypothetical protein
MFQTKKIPWFYWHGSFVERNLKELIVKRTSYDGFQNVYCPAISYSKLTCNTNIAFVMPGPFAQYCFHYTTKGTQKSESEEYDNVKMATEIFFQKYVVIKMMQLKLYANY